jgi:D-aspartate ligase
MRSSKPEGTMQEMSPAEGVLGAVVMGGDYRGLGVVRSLGRHGIPVWVLWTEGQRLATFSRYAQRSVPWPAEYDVERFTFLADLASNNGLAGWVLIPTSDESATLIARHHAKLSKLYRLTTPPWRTLRWAHDKRLTYELASRLQVSYPQTYYPRNREELAASTCRFPVILKPAFRNTFKRFTPVKAWRADDRQALLDHYDTLCGLVDPDIVMVQELIPGWGDAQFSYAAVCQNGCPVAALVANRVRQFPSDFGRASTCVQTVDEPAVIEPSCRILEALKFTGLVEIEYKYDARDGQYKLLDINPRVWGWHSLGSRAGVDFAYLLWLQTCGSPVPESRPRNGVRWVRASTDAQAVFVEILRGRLSLGEYARSLFSPTESAILSKDDPVPGLLEFPLLAYLLGTRALRGRDRSLPTRLEKAELP